MNVKITAEPAGDHGVQLGISLSGDPAGAGVTLEQVAQACVAMYEERRRAPDEAPEGAPASGSAATPVRSVRGYVTSAKTLMPMVGTTITGTPQPVEVSSDSGRVVLLVLSSTPRGAPPETSWIVLGYVSAPGALSNPYQFIQAGDLVDIEGVPAPEFFGVPALIACSCKVVSRPSQEDIPAIFG